MAPIFPAEPVAELLAIFWSARWWYRPLVIVEGKYRLLLMAKSISEAFTTPVLGHAIV
jgi:hypothetical protein